MSLIRRMMADNCAQSIGNTDESTESTLRNCTGGTANFSCNGLSSPSQTVTNLGQPPSKKTTFSLHAFADSHFEAHAPENQDELSFMYVQGSF